MAPSAAAAPTWPPMRRSVVGELTAIMDADIAPAVHRDVWAWDAADPTLGAPPAGFVPSYDSGAASIRCKSRSRLFTEGAFPFQLIHSPEQALRDQDSLLGLVNRAGAGDTILVEQLYENLYWGAESSNVDGRSEPAPAGVHCRRAPRGKGARTARRLLRQPGPGQPAQQPAHGGVSDSVAQAEGLDLQARRRNPTGQGIHNKMVLAQIGGQGWAVVGSLNGGEVSAKLNREMALLVGSDEVYAYLADVFWYDWNVTP